MTSELPKITFVGTGYVGLPWAAAFASSGYSVYALDTNEEKITKIKAKVCPFEEPGLCELLEKTIDSGKLIPTTSYEEAIPNSQVVFICVGTPCDDDGRADLTYVLAAAEQVARNLGDGFTVIVDRSTVPPGTTKLVENKIKKTLGSAHKDFAVVSSPEFLRQGHAVEDTIKPSRIIIGTHDQKAVDLMLLIYNHIDCPKVVMSPESAELVKYASNAYLALRIVFADQMANLAEGAGADVLDVLKGAGLDPRIGSHFWYPGLGYGGYCFPKDVKALASVYTDLTGELSSLFSESDRLNTERIQRFCKILESKLGSLKDKTITVWGLSAKPQSPDMRGSTPADLIEALRLRGAKVCAFDPYAASEAKMVVHEEVQLHDGHLESLAGGEALLILTEHQIFKEYDYAEVLKKLSGKVLIDAKRILDPIKMQNLGFDYVGTGYGLAN